MTALLDTALRDTAWLDTAPLDTAPLDTTLREATLREATLPDTAPPDTALPDTALPPGQRGSRRYRPRARSRASTVAARTSPTAARRAATTGSPARPTLHLTRRARLIVTTSLALSLVAVVGLSMLNAGQAAGELGDAPASVVVQTGDTLWQIAGEVAPAEDPVAVVELLRSTNDLGGGPLQPGRVLVIPRG